MIKKSVVARYVIGFQGFYYLIAGIFSTFFIRIFEQLTFHTHEGLDFGTHMLTGALVIVIGLYYLYNIIKKDLLKNKELVHLAIGIALAIALIELLFLPRTWNLLWLDFAEEVVFIVLLLWIAAR